MFLAEYAEDKEKWTGGAAVYIPHSGGYITFYVRRWGIPESEKYIKRIKQELYGPFHRNMEVDEHLVYAHWLAGYGVARWDKFKDSDGQEFEYSEEMARRLFLDERYFYDLNPKILSCAMSSEYYLYQQAEEAAEEIKKP